MVWHKWDPVCSPPRGLVRPVPVDPLGVVGPTRGQAQGPTWRTTSRGLFVPASVDLSVPEQRILEESMRLPSTGAVTGWGACRLHGANYCDGLGGDGLTPLPVPLAVGPGFTIRHDSGVRVSHDRLPAADVLVRQGIPTVRATRGVFDMMRFAPGVRAAVAGLDMAVAARITSIERVAVWTTQHPGCTGIDQVRLALPLAREQVRSGPESGLRLVCEVDAGFPRLEVNCPVRDLTGRLLGIADLLDVDAGLVVEFDGAEHRGITRHNADLKKDEALRQVRMEVTRVSGTDLLNRRMVVQRLLHARARARFEPPQARLWVAEPVPDSAEQELQEREALIDSYERLREPQPRSA